MLKTTLEYPISMGVRLLIFPKFSTQHALIPYHTFINFIKNLQPIRLFHIECFSYTIFFCIFFPWRCRIITQIVSKCHDRANLLPNLQKIRIIEKISTQYTIMPPHVHYFLGFFPPNTIIPYHTFIFLELTQYSYSIPYGY